MLSYLLQSGRSEFLTAVSEFLIMCQNRRGHQLLVYDMRIVVVAMIGYKGNTVLCHGIVEMLITDGHHLQ